MIKKVESHKKISKKAIEKRDKFNSLNLNIRNLKKHPNASISPIRHRGARLSPEPSENIKLDPSIERSLEQISIPNAKSRNANDKR